MSKGWRQVKLSDVCEIQRGGSPRPISDYITDADDGINWIKIGDVAEGAKYLYTTKEKIKPEGAKRSREVKSGDFLLSNSMSFGRPYILRTSGCIHDGWLVLRDKQNQLNEDYLYHVLSSDFVYAQFKKFAVGAVVKNLNIEVVEKVEIPLPSLPEQIRIAAIFDQADALRDKRREALAQLDSLTQAVFIEMFGDPVTNPMGWQVTPLKTVAEKITDGEHQTPKRTEFGIKLLSARNIRDGYLDFGDVDFIDVAEHQKISKRCNPERGDILISCSGSIGRVAIVETDEPLGLVRSAALVKPNRQKILSKYLETFLRTPHMNRMMINKAHSSSQANLFQGPIRALPIALPPIALQQEFVKKSVALQTLRNSHNAANAELDNLFASLQHRAFRGEL